MRPSKSGQRQVGREEQRIRLSKQGNEGGREIEEGTGVAR